MKFSRRKFLRLAAGVTVLPAALRIARATPTRRGRCGSLPAFPSAARLTRLRG
jgi:hypothetical protein